MSCLEQQTRGSAQSALIAFMALSYGARPLERATAMVSTQATALARLPSYVSAGLRDPLVAIASAGNRLDPIIDLVQHPARSVYDMVALTGKSFADASSVASVTLRMTSEILEALNAVLNDPTKWYTLF